VHLKTPKKLVTPCNSKYKELPGWHD